MSGRFAGWHKKPWIVRLLTGWTAILGLMAGGVWVTIPKSRPVTTREGPIPDQVGGEDKTNLEVACHQTSVWLARQLDPRSAVLVRPPFVLSGDLSTEELAIQYRQTLAPCAQAMATEYWDGLIPASEPIVVLLFARESTYREQARWLFGDENVSAFGYYRPHLRTILVNLQRGPSGLKHELTHALMAFDFPDAPDWFSEGLASLHEDSRVRSDGHGLEGLVNWRLQILQERVRQGRFQSPSTLWKGGDFRGPEERLNYATARYFCLFLQRRGLLGRFYRRFRAQVQQDPLGAAAVAEMFPEWSQEDLDARFCDWVMQLSP